MTSEMLLALLPSHFKSVAQRVGLMFSDLNVDDSWFRVLASLTPKKLHL